MPPRKSTSRRKSSRAEVIPVKDEDILPCPFETLSDCVIEGILFTGYINDSSVLELLSISKRIRKIGNSAIRYLDLRSLCNVNNSIAKVPKVAINLMSLDLSYSDLNNSFTGIDLLLHRFLLVKSKVFFSLSNHI